MQLGGRFIWSLIFALLMAQGLGTLHKVVHGLHVDAAHEHSVVEKHGLFDGHSLPECRLFDQLTCGDALTAGFAFGQQPTPVVFVPGFSLATSQALWVAPFQARAPPQVL